MDFKDQLRNYQEFINKELEKKVRKQECLEYILNRSVEYSLMAGGKRLRPILVLATYEIFKKDIEICLPYAIAIEMVHNFSLIHDDLPGIDNDDFRHGKLKESKTEKNQEEILNNKIKVFNEFSNAVDRMIAGEYVDTEYEGKDITTEDLDYIHQNKTGALLKLCVRMGAILANASEEDAKSLTIYAEKIGLAFQIKDDILSEEGDEKVLGKPVGNDKEMKKCTYVSKYGLQKSKEILENITNEAIQELDKYGEKAIFLKELAKYIQNRNK